MHFLSNVHMNSTISVSFDITGPLVKQKIGRASLLVRAGFQTHTDAMYMTRLDQLSEDSVFDVGAVCRVKC